MRKKKLLIICVVALCSILLLFPIKIQLKDGGTVRYCAILYRITFWHSLNESYESGYYEDTEFEIFPFNFING